MLIMRIWVLFNSKILQNINFIKKVTIKINLKIVVDHKIALNAI